MTLQKSYVLRAVDSTGTKILTYEDTAQEIEVQAVTIVDAAGNQTGVVNNPLLVDTSIAEYYTNDIEEASTTVTYVGKEKADGTWLLMKIDITTGTVIRYASEVNNALVTDYASAWADRATLVYETFAEAV